MPIQLRRTPLSTQDEGNLRIAEMPRMNPTSASAGYAALAQGTAKLGDVISKLADVEDKKRSVEENSAALHLKLDGLLRAVPAARERESIDLEMRDEKELEAERTKLFAECRVCTTPEQHMRHLRLQTGLDPAQSQRSHSA